MKAPLPDSVYVNYENGHWIAQARYQILSICHAHLRGASNLYNNEPLLIVWAPAGCRSEQDHGRNGEAQAKVLLYNGWDDTR